MVVWGWDVLSWCGASEHRFSSATKKRAANGEEAIRLCELEMKEETGGYDVIFMDKQMPVMGGLQATRSLTVRRTHSVRAHGDGVPPALRRRPLLLPFLPRARPSRRPLAWLRVRRRRRR